MVETTGESSLPLDDVTVVALTQVVAGPFATMTLGDMGADIVKIEAVGRGDRSRQTSPREKYYEVVNRNKRSIAINLKSDDGQEIARRLLADADVFVESAKPGRISDFGLSESAVREINEDVIYCSLSGFGSGTVYESVPALDILIQAMSGMMSMTGTDESGPAWSGLPVGDLIASMYVVQSVLAALLGQAYGKTSGEHIEVSMFDAAISWLTTRAAHTFGTGDPFPRGSHPGMAPFSVYDTADGKLAVAAATDSLWMEFCEAMDRPDIAADERFETQSARVANRDALESAVEETLKRRTTEKWIDVMHDRSLPVGPVHDTKSIWEDDHVQQRGLHRLMERTDGTTAEGIDHPVRFERLETSIREAPPTLGADTTEILREHGYDAGEIGRFRLDGTVE